MFDLLDVPPEIVDRPGRASRSSCRQATVRFEDVIFHYDPDRAILKGISFEVPGGRTVADRRPLRRRQVDHLAAPLPLLRRDRRPHHRSTGRTSAT